MGEGNSIRTVRSFVRREGRLTQGQQHALDALWPKWGIDSNDKQIKLAKLFKRDAPKVLEIGFGNGRSLAIMAKAQPDKDFIGIEVHRPGIGQLLSLTKKLQLTNIRVAYADAVEIIKNRIADSTLYRVQLYFPDPWHKKRHHKRRIIQDAFIKLLATKIEFGGYLHMATDCQHYAENMLHELSSSDDFINLGNVSGYITRPNTRPYTKFEKRGKRLGNNIWDLLFERR